MSLRTVNPNLKVLLAIGGWTHGTAPFTALVDDPNDIAQFAANALTYLKTYNFDGLDLDWEYPGGNGSPPEDKQRFTTLVQVGSTPSYCNCLCSFTASGSFTFIFCLETETSLWRGWNNKQRSSYVVDSRCGRRQEHRRQCLWSWPHLSVSLNQSENCPFIMNNLLQFYKMLQRLKCFCLYVSEI